MNQPEASGTTPFRELAYRYFMLVGIPVMDNGDLLQIQDPTGMPVLFRFEPLAEGETEEMPPGMMGMPPPPGAPLPVQYLGPGSKPFERILKDLRTRGRVVRLYGRKPFREREIQGEIRQWMGADMPEASIAFSGTRTEFVPWLMMNLKLAFVTDEKVEELVSLAVNLVDGNLREGYWQNVSGLALRADKPLGGVARRRMTVRGGYGLAKERIMEMIASRDPSWAQRAMERMEEEISTLEGYYGTLMATDDGGSAREELERRTEEQRGKFKPRVVVDLVNMGIVYVPTLCMIATAQLADGRTASWRITVDGGTEEKQATPLSGQEGIATGNQYVH